MARAGLAWTISQAAERGEPFLSLFRPAEIDDLMRRSGFTCVEQFGPRQLLDLYLADQSAAQLTGIERLAAGYV
jgi:hypothetical protein